MKLTPLNFKYFLLNGIARGFQKQTKGHVMGFRCLVSWCSGALTGNLINFVFNSDP